jgi:hypothetical protein
MTIPRFFSRDDHCMPTPMVVEYRIDNIVLRLPVSETLTLHISNNTSVTTMSLGERLDQAFSGTLSRDSATFTSSEKAMLTAFSKS